MLRIDSEWVTVVFETNRKQIRFLYMETKSLPVVKEHLAENIFLQNLFNHASDP
jgi:hypothetical protein